MRLRLVFDGLNIKGCKIIGHQYLYTINDTISRTPTIIDYEKEEISGDKESQNVS